MWLVAERTGNGLNMVAWENVEYMQLVSLSLIVSWRWLWLYLWLWQVDLVGVVVGFVVELQRRVC